MRSYVGYTSHHLDKVRFWVFADPLIQWQVRVVFGRHVALMGIGHGEEEAVV